MNSIDELWKGFDSYLPSMVVTDVDGLWWVDIYSVTTEAWQGDARPVSKSMQLYRWLMDDLLQENLSVPSWFNPEHMIHVVLRFRLLMDHGQPYRHLYHRIYDRLTCQPIEENSHDIPLLSETTPSLRRRIPKNDMPHGS